MEDVAVPLEHWVQVDAVAAGVPYLSTFAALASYSDFDCLARHPTHHAEQRCDQCFSHSLLPPVASILQSSPKDFVPPPELGSSALGVPNVVVVVQVAKLLDPFLIQLLLQRQLPVYSPAYLYAREPSSYAFRLSLSRSLVLIHFR